MLRTDKALTSREFSWCMEKTALLLVAALVVLSGCGSALDGDTASETTAPTTAPGTSFQTDHSTSTTTASDVDTTSSRPANLTDRAVGARAAAAEEERIETVLSGLDNITEFYVGDVGQSAYSILEYNDTGAIVIVRGVHSGTLDCGGGDQYVFDGARTRTRYFVTEQSVRLVRVNESVYGLSTNPCT